MSCLDQFRIRPDTDSVNPAKAAQVEPQVSCRLPRHAPGEWFLKGPVPWIWVRAAMRLKGRALHVGVALWQRAFMAGSATVIMPSRELKELKISRTSIQRGLDALEAATLVTVRRGRGKLPRVTLVNPKLPCAQPHPAPASQLLGDAGPCTKNRE